MTLEIKGGNLKGLRTSPLIASVKLPVRKSQLSWMIDVMDELEVYVAVMMIGILYNQKRQWKLKDIVTAKSYRWQQSDKCLNEPVQNDHTVDPCLTNLIRSLVTFSS